MFAGCLMVRSLGERRWVISGSKLWRKLRNGTFDGVNDFQCRNEMAVKSSCCVITFAATCITL